SSAHKVAAICVRLNLRAKQLISLDNKGTRSNVKLRQFRLPMTTNLGAGGSNPSGRATPKPPKAAKRLREAIVSSTKSWRPGRPTTVGRVRVLQTFPKSYAVAA